MQENSTNWNSVSLLILKITLYLALASHLSSSIHMPEFFEHLAIGHWITANHEIPRFYIWSSSNHLWADPNWIFEIVISYLETYAGEKGLIVFKIASIFISICSLSSLFQVFSRSNFFVCLLALYVSAGVFVTNDLLPYCLSIFMAVLFIQISRKESLTRLQTLILFLLGYLLANIDTNAFLVTALSLLLLKRNVGTLIVILTVSLFSPPYYGLQIFEGLSSTLRIISWDVLLQRSKADIFDFRFAFLLLLWILSALKAKNIFSRQHKILLIFSVFFSILGMASTNCLPMALIITGVLLSSLWDSEEPDQLSLSLEYLAVKLSKISALGIIWVLVVICIITIKPRIAYPVSYALLPKKEIDLILNRGVKLPLYHDSFVGSYLSYRLSMAGLDARKVVMSTLRSENYPKQSSAIRMNFLSQSLNPQFLKYFDFMAPKSVICRQSEPLCTYLLASHDWQLISSAVDSNNKQSEVFGWRLFERRE